MQISAVDETGFIAWSSISGRQRVDLRDREHVRVHLDDRVQGLFVSAPVLGRVSGRWTIQFTRAVRRGGVLKGVIVFSVDLAYLSRFYGSLPLEPRDSITVLRQDGTVLARVPGEGNEMGQKFKDLPYIGPGASAEGAFRHSDPLDGILRSHAWKRIARGDLVVSAALDEENALQAFRTHRAWIVVATLVVSLMLVGLAAALLRALRWRLRQAAQLRAEKGNLEAAVAGRALELTTVIEDLRTARDGLAHLGDVVAQTRDAVISFDRRGIVQTWNASAERIFGYSEREMLGHPVSVIARTLDTPSITNDYRRLAAGEDLSPKRVIRVAKDGREVPVELSRSPIRDKQGAIVGYSMIVRDVTEQMRVEEQLRQSQKLEAIGQLTGGLAHDFNNLLGVVVGNLDQIGEVLPEGGAARGHHRAALDAALRGAEVTRSLLAVARRQPLEVGSHDLNGLLVEMLPLLKSSAGSAVSVVAQLSEGELQSRLDAGGLSNVVLNLVTRVKSSVEWLNEPLVSNPKTQDFLL